MNQESDKQCSELERFLQMMDSFSVPVGVMDEDDGITHVDILNDTFVFKNGAFVDVITCTEFDD